MEYGRCHQIISITTFILLVNRHGKHTLFNTGWVDRTLNSPLKDTAWAKKHELVFTFNRTQLSCFYFVENYTNLPPGSSCSCKLFPEKPWPCVNQESVLILGPVPQSPIRLIPDEWNSSSWSLTKQRSRVSNKKNMTVWCSTLQCRHFGRESVSYSETNWHGHFDLTLSLLRVINVEIPLQPHKNMTSHSMENFIAYSDQR